jgi:hypothetical protein
MSTAIVADAFGGFIGRSQIALLSGWIVTVGGQMFHLGQVLFFDPILCNFWVAFLKQPRHSVS